MCCAFQRPQLVKGNMQLFSVDQQRSQALEAHAASFASYKVSCHLEKFVLSSGHYAGLQLELDYWLHILKLCILVWKLSSSRECAFLPVTFHPKVDFCLWDKTECLQVPGSDRPSVLISFATKALMGAQLVSKLHVIELGAQPGLFFFLVTHNNGNPLIGLRWPGANLHRSWLHFPQNQSVLGSLRPSCMSLSWVPNQVG